MDLLFIVLILSLLGNACAVGLWIRACAHRKKLDQAEELDLSHVDLTIEGNEDLHLLFRPNMEEAMTLRAGDVVKLSELSAAPLSGLSLAQEDKRFLLDPEMENCLVHVEAVTQLTKGSLLIEGKLKQL